MHKFGPDESIAPRAAKAGGGWTFKSVHGCHGYSVVMQATAHQPSLDIVPDMNNTFIVGTGRCGSTMVSRLLAGHRDVLSVNELFVTLPLDASVDLTARIDGREFWTLLSTPDPYIDDLVAHEFGFPELRYPYETGRFQIGAGGVPLISHMTLPGLPGDPDLLFTELSAEIRTWPSRSTSAHLEYFLQHLHKRFGRRKTVERTGGSLPGVGAIAGMFPDARFVYLRRNGPDTALSLSKHVASRVIGLQEELHELVRSVHDPATEERLGEIRRALTQPLDVRRVMNCAAPPLPVFGRLWSRMTVSGLAALKKLPEDSWISVHYDTLVEKPRQELARLVDFIGVEASDEWLASSCVLIDRTRTGRSATLAPDVYDSLQAACEPGDRANTRWAEAPERG